jgi:aspartate/glutamate racemase
LGPDPRAFLRHLIQNADDRDSNAMASPRFREAFAKYGIEASGLLDESLRAMTAELITDLQLGESVSADQRLATVARVSLDENQFRNQPAVCLACTELPLAFAKMK